LREPGLIHDERHVDRNSVRGHNCDGLRHAVVEELEIRSGQATDRCVPTGHRNIERDNVSGRAELGSALFRLGKQRADAGRET
jgi:hypothetical protein